jgi:hypothetical protein
MSRIGVLFHRRERKPASYLIHHLSRYWKEDGHHVEYLFGTDRFVPADIVIVHVDLSVVPEEYLDFAARYRKIVNGQLRDIRKRTVSGNLVGLSDAWEGPVIVKSDLNSLGRPERRMQRTFLERRWPRLQGMRDYVLRRLRHVSISDVAFNYRIFERKEDVPVALFRDEFAVVEKFLPEVGEEGLYHLRMAQFMGDRVRCTRIASRNPVVKAANSVFAEDIDADADVLQWRRRFHLDYGKIDYVVSDGKPVVVDVNKTVGRSRHYRDKSTLDSARRFLAEGIYSYLE